MMARDNIKKKLGGKANIDFVTTLLGDEQGRYSIFDEQIDAAYEILQADAAYDKKWQALSDASGAYQQQVSSTNPYDIFLDKVLTGIAKKNLDLRFPDPTVDKDKSGIPDFDEALPDKIRELKSNIEEIFIELDLSTLASAEAALTTAEQSLDDEEQKEKVSSRTKEFAGKTPVDPIVDRKNPFGDKSTPTWENKLKTAFGKLYWDRNLLLSKFSKLRKDTLKRDEDLQKAMIDLIATRQSALNFEKKSDYWNDEYKAKDSELIKTVAQWEKKMASKQTELDLANTNYKNSEEERRKSDENWQKTMDDSKANYETQLQNKDREAIAAEQRGYETGRAEAIKEFKGELATDEKPENFFDDPNSAPVPAPAQTPVATPTSPNMTGENGTMAPGLQGEQYTGIVTNVARISARDGIIILPVGSEEGLTPGSMFTLIKEGKQAARIKVTQITPTYCIANILPQFGDPRRLRPGDQIQVIR